MKRENYQPGEANLAQIEKDGENWKLVIVRDFNHPPERVWAALTIPENLKEWAPFDSNRSLGEVGSATLTVVGMGQVSETEVTRADAPSLLEYTWGGQELRWKLDPIDNGTRLTLWHNIDRRFIAMGAAGWQICLDVMESTLDGESIGRIVANDALKFDGWHRLHKAYANQFGVEEVTMKEM